MTVVYTVAKRFRVLRGHLTAVGLEQKELARRMGVSLPYVSSRMTGRGAFTADEMYFILDLLSTPHEHMHVIFPPEGLAPLGETPNLVGQITTQSR